MLTTDPFRVPSVVPADGEKHTQMERNPNMDESSLIVFKVMTIGL